MKNAPSTQEQTEIHRRMVLARKLEELLGKEMALADPFPKVEIHAPSLAYTETAQWS
jgi:hypothetical protein